MEQRPTQRPVAQTTLADLSGTAGTLASSSGPVSAVGAVLAEPEVANARPNIFKQLPYAVLALRPKQWSKNGLVLLALIFAERLTDPTAVVRTLLAFLAFSFAASTIYIVNDIGDRKRDRVHPKKRKRPIASGKLSVPLALCTAVLSMALVVGLSLVLTIGALWSPMAQALGLDAQPYAGDPAARWGGSGFLFAMVIAGYLLMNVAYTIRLKHLVLWDVFIVAAGFVLRAFAGALAIPVPISPWFYLCTLFLALFLALGKRRAEIVQAAENATQQRKVLQEYSLGLLDQLMGVVVTCTILTYSLYTFESGTASHALIVTIPFVIFGVFRYLYLIYVKADGERPDELLFKDKQILGAVLLCVLVTVIVLYGFPLARAHQLLP